ncbi:hypothetical protein PIB30_100869, partial [Stylosanthes scabra]|nr:hypothetical protein [Stylosanthes scabra]
GGRDSRGHSSSSVDEGWWSRRRGPLQLNGGDTARRRRSDGGDGLRRRLVVTQKRSPAAERRRHGQAEAQRRRGWASSKDDGELRLLHEREAQGPNVVPSAVKGTVHNGVERERGRRRRKGKGGDDGGFLCEGGFGEEIWRREGCSNGGCTMRPTYMTYSSPLPADFAAEKSAGNELLRGQNAAFHLIAYEGIFWTEIPP